MEEIKYYGSFDNVEILEDDDMVNAEIHAVKVEDLDGFLDDEDVETHLFYITCSLEKWERVGEYEEGDCVCFTDVNGNLESVHTMLDDISGDEVQMGRKKLRFLPMNSDIYLKTMMN